jgi:hypothetical protein
MLPRELLRSEYGLTESSDFALTPGRVYDVEALTVFLGWIWYYVMDDGGAWYPVWKPAPLFDVVDGSVPAEWRFAHLSNPHTGASYPILSFPEWASDIFFYDRLIAREESAVTAFERHRRAAPTEPS